MSLHINFRLSDSDLEYFSGVMREARAKAKDVSQQEIISNAEKLLERVTKSDTADFIRDHMNQIETLIGMIIDEGWGLIEDDRERVLTALSYFSESQDLIPDDTPALGYLDDAIIIDIVCKALEHEIQAYSEFLIFRAREINRRGNDAASVASSNAEAV